MEYIPHPVIASVWFCTRLFLPIFYLSLLFSCLFLYCLVLLLFIALDFYLFFFYLLLLLFRLLISTCSFSLFFQFFLLLFVLFRLLHPTQSKELQTKQAHKQASPRKPRLQGWVVHPARYLDISWSACFLMLSCCHPVLLGADIV